MISIIAAMTIDGVIGKDGKLPWNIPEELSLFHRMTMGNTVVMGRKTFESMNGGLKGRNNIVVSKTLTRADGVDVCRSVEEGLEKAMKYNKEIFIIGGGQIYLETIGISDRMYLSYVKESHIGDVFFPKFDMGDWIEEKRVAHKRFDQVVYVRR